MKKFLKYIALFIALVVVFLVGLEWLAQRVPNPYRTKAQYMEQNADRIETLILGSSHTYMGVAPEVMDSTGGAYNLACVSQTLLYDYELLRLYIDKMPHLRCVVLPVSLFSLYDVDFDKQGAFLRKYYQLYYGIRLTYDPLTWLEVGDMPIALTKIKEYYVMHTDMVQLTPYGQSKAYFLANKSPEDWEHTRQKAEGHRRNGSIDPRAVVYLNKIAELCQQHGVELVLVSTPTRPGYRQMANAAQIDQIRSTLSSLTNKYTCARYFDMSADERFEDCDDLFFDADHLTDLGAQKFSRILADTMALSAF